MSRLVTPKKIIVEHIGSLKSNDQSSTKQMGNVMQCLTQSQSQVSVTVQKADSRLTQIAKFIPAEILAFYSMWAEGVSSIKNQFSSLPVEMPLILCIVGILIGTIACYLYFDLAFPNEPKSSIKAHKLISPFAFLVYSYTITGAVIPGIYISGIALIMTSVITMVSAMYVPTETPN